MMAELAPELAPKPAPLLGLEQPVSNLQYHSLRLQGHPPSTRC